MNTIQSNVFLERERLVKKGFMRRSDIQRFLSCDFKKADRLYKDIEKGFEAQGLMLSMFGIRTVDFLEYIGSSTKDVLRDAELERKNNPTLDQK